jgi:hypothetical protein
MIKRINKILASKESSDKKTFQIQKVFQSTLKDTIKFNDNYFGEILIEIKEGKLNKFKTIDRYEDKKLLELNKRAYKDLILKLLSPSKLLTLIDGYNKKEIIRLNKRNKTIADWYLSKIIEENIETETLSREVLFLDNRFIHDLKEKRENNQIIYSIYIENISVKYLSFLTLNKLVENVNVILKSGQMKETQQLLNVFPKSVIKRPSIRDSYGNTVIDKQNYTKVNNIQPNDFLFNCEIEIILNKTLNEYEKIVFLSDLNKNGILGTFEFTEKNEAPIKLMDLYSLFMTINDSQED